MVCWKIPDLQIMISPFKPPLRADFLPRKRLPEGMGKIRDKFLVPLGIL